MVDTQYINLYALRDPDPDNI